MLSMSQWLAAVQQKLMAAKTNRWHETRRRPKSWSRVPAVVEVLETRRLLIAVVTNGLAEDPLDEAIVQQTQTQTQSFAPAQADVQAAMSSAGASAETSWNQAAGAVGGAVADITTAASGIAASDFYASSGMGTTLLSGISSGYGQPFTPSFGDPAAWVSSISGSGPAAGQPAGVSDWATYSPGSGSPGDNSLPGSVGSSSSDYWSSGSAAPVLVSPPTVTSPNEMFGTSASSSGGGNWYYTSNTEGSGSGSGTESSSGSGSGTESGSGSGSESTSGSGSTSGSSSASGSGSSTSNTGYQLQSGYWIDSQTQFVLQNPGNLNSTTTSTDPVNETETTDDGILYFTTGSADTSMVIVATVDGIGGWTYSETYSRDEAVVIVGSDGSSTTSDSSVQYVFVASGDATSTTFNFIITASGTLNGTQTETWLDTADDGSQSGGTIDWTWTSVSSETAEIDSTWNLIDNTALVTSDWSSDLTESGSGAGTYCYDIPGGTVSGTITSTFTNSDDFSGSGTESRATDGTWTWTAGTAQFAGTASSHFTSAGTGSFTINEDGILLTGAIEESSGSLDESSGSGSALVGLDGKWAWTGTASFEGTETTSLASSATGTYSDVTDDSTMSGTLSTQSGYTSATAYSGAGTLGGVAENETWTWSQGGATFTSAGSSAFDSSGAGTYWYETTGASVTGTQSLQTSDRESEEITITSTLQSDGTWSATSGLAKSAGTSWSISGYSGTGTYSYDMADPPGDETGSNGEGGEGSGSGSGEASGSGSSSGGESSGSSSSGGETPPAEPAPTVTGIMQGTIMESGSATDSVAYSAEQSLQSDGTWTWNWGSATNTASLESHYASSGAGEYSYDASDDDASLPGAVSGTVTGDIAEASYDDLYANTNQQATLGTDGEWTVTSGVMDASGSAGQSSSYTGGGDYSRIYGDSAIEGKMTEVGAGGTDLSYNVHAALDSQGDWQWTSGTSHITSESSTDSIYSASDDFTWANFGDFSGEAKEVGERKLQFTEEIHQTLSTEGDWTPTSGSSDLSIEDKSSAWYLGKGIFHLNQTEPAENGSTLNLSIGFTLENTQHASLAQNVTKTVQTNGEWAVDSSEKQESKYDGTNTAYSGDGLYTYGEGPVSFEMEISIAGGSVTTNADDQTSSLDSSNEWQLTSGKKSSSDHNNMHIGYSGTGDVLPVDGGDAGTIQITGNHDHESSYSDVHQLGIAGDWQLASGDKSTFYGAGYSFLLTGTRTEFVEVTNVTGVTTGSLESVAEYTALAYQSGTATMSSVVAGDGTGQADWSSAVGEQTATDGNEFSYVVAGNGSVILSVMDGDLAATVQSAGSESNERHRSQHYVLDSNGEWIQDGGTIVESVASSSKLTMNGTGTYSRVVDGGAVSGVTHLLELTTAKAETTTQTQTFSSNGGWSYTEGSMTDHVEDKVNFTYDGLGVYSHDAVGGSVIGAISEGGLFLLDDTKDLTYSLDGGGNWVLDHANGLRTLNDSSKLSSSGKGGYTYSVVGGGVVGLVEEQSWQNTSHIETVTLSAGTIGAPISIGTKSIDNDAGTETKYAGTGSYEYHLGSQGITENSGTVSGDIQEDGGTSTSNSNNETWTIGLNGDWTPVSGSRVASASITSNMSSSGSGTYAYEVLSDENGEYSNVTHGGTIIEGSESHFTSSTSQVDSLTANGTWAQLSGATSEVASDHSSRDSSGSGTYTFSTGGTSSNVSYKYVSGDLTESESTLNDSFYSYQTLFTTAEGWIVTSGTKSTTTSSNDHTFATGDGTYDRSITDGSVTGFVLGTVKTDYTEHLRESSYADTWNADSNGAWTLTEGTKSDVSYDNSKQEWSGSGLYTRDSNVNGLKTKATGTVYDIDSEEHRENYISDEWQVNAEHEWEQTSGSKYKSIGTTTQTILSGEGTYTRDLTDGYSGTLNGKFTEGAGKYYQTVNDDMWSFEDDWVQDSGLEKTVSKMGESYTYDGSGTYKHDIIADGTYSRDYQTEARTVNETKSKLFDDQSKSWIHSWTGLTSHELTVEYAYSGENTVTPDPVTTSTTPNQTIVSQSSKTLKEDINFKSYSKVTNDWFSDWNGTKGGTVDTKSTLLNDRYTLASGWNTSLLTEWSTAGSGGGDKQTRTVQTQSSSLSSSKFHTESSGSSHVVTDASGVASGGGTTSSSGFVDQTQSWWSKVVESHEGPQQNGSATTTSSSSNVTHDDFKATHTTDASVTGSGGSTTSNHVTGNRTTSHSILTVLVDGDGNSKNDPNNFNSGPTTTTYDEQVNYGGFYLQAYFTQPPPSQSNHFYGVPEGTGVGGNSPYGNRDTLDHATDLFVTWTNQLTFGGYKALLGDTAYLRHVDWDSTAAKFGNAIGAAHVMGLAVVGGGTTALATCGSRFALLATGYNFALTGMAAYGMGTGAFDTVNHIYNGNWTKAGWSALETGVNGLGLLGGFKNLWTGCFDADTMVIVGPRAATLATTSPTAETVRWEWLVAATGIVLVSRLAVRRLRQQDDEKLTADLRYAQRCGLRLAPPNSPSYAGMGKGGRASQFLEPIMPQWVRVMYGVDTVVPVETIDDELPSHGSVVSPTNGSDLDPSVEGVLPNDSVVHRLDGIPSAPGSAAVTSPVLDSPPVPFETEQFVSETELAEAFLESSDEALLGSVFSGRSRSNDVPSWPRENEDHAPMPYQEPIFGPVSTFKPRTKDRRKAARDSTGASRLRRGLISAVSVVSLLLAAACVWQTLPNRAPAIASTEVDRPAQGPAEESIEFKRIAEIQPLDWVLAGNPKDEPDLEFGEEIEPSEWRMLTLAAKKADGSIADIRMARPLSWLYDQSTVGESRLDVIPVNSHTLTSLDLREFDEEFSEGSATELSFPRRRESSARGDVEVEHLTHPQQKSTPKVSTPSPFLINPIDLSGFDPQSLVGRSIDISVPECGIDGEATVLAVNTCPKLKPRPGPDYQLVTATFHHRNAKLMDLAIEGVESSIGTTPNHPFWSEDRQEFVRADTLKRGERLRGQNGTHPKVLSSVMRPGTHDVYNLEVAIDHVYHVSSSGILVHNGDAIPCKGYVYVLFGNVLGRMHNYVGSAFIHRFPRRLTDFNHLAAKTILNGSEVRMRVFEVDLSGVTARGDAFRILRVNEQQVLNDVLSRTSGVLGGVGDGWVNLNKHNARSFAKFLVEENVLGNRYKEVPLLSIPWR